ncbi:hypothetical protein SEA_DELIAN_48 [Gordonia phage Delian]|uniref:hypothetical protein n=1 Tax=Gordonia phage CaptainKirk2 TaxID=1887643 RepID=UPI00084F3E12|nr:hypothetical protein BIZ76_gp45 [Gordonia phage CaptainKirk2]AXH67470.1 hypothetical protein SEA_ZARBODNAMRA_44 [Gordonia phage Zarbodnamra]QBG78518.1 hypothetical protein SEA_BARCO_43 [Gordonia phage Barco]QDB74548.1 hypothetical protein SEA_MELBA_44 [Gordonia phage Melba]QDH85366.1 hypothetical protein SEA_MINTFEN_45 [Gordonia phage MintFen]QGH77968.1 hypothetical protein SEA_DELIAN_48 [Gordonia phage Delian]QKO02363.1 hypothetical protein SEA_BLINGBLING_42 [Gordonia phage BlingBling]QN
MRNKNARRIYEGQAETLNKRVEQYDESAADLGKTFSQLAEMGDPSTKELCLTLGSALIQSNVLIARMISVAQAEHSLTAIAAAAGYLTDERLQAKTAEMGSDVPSRLNDETRLLIQEQGITVDPDALAGLSVSLDCGNGVTKHLSALGANELGRALVAAWAAASQGERVDQ